MKVFIAGMHRSGTSMVTGLLQMCGLYLGDNLNPPRKDNPKGFFEDFGFLALNREIFALNSDGKGGGHRPPKEITVLPDDLIRRMKEFIEEWPKDEVVGWKDPRACITLPIWRRLIYPEEIRVVVTSRPFIEIARSLNNRHGMKMRVGMNLSQFYMRALHKNLEDTKWIETLYHNYFKADWIIEIKALVKFLGLNMPEDLSPLKNFIDIKLWHYRGQK